MCTSTVLALWATIEDCIVTFGDVMSIYGVINAVCEVPDENEACPSRYPDFGRTSGDPATGIGIDSRRGRSAMTTASRSFTEAWLTEQVRGSAVGEDPPNHVMGVRWVQGRPAPVDAWADASSETLTGGRRGRLDVRRLQHTDSRTHALAHPTRAAGCGSAHPRGRDGPGPRI